MQPRATDDGVLSRGRVLLLFAGQGSLLPGVTTQARTAWATAHALHQRLSAELRRHCKVDLEGVLAGRISPTDDEGFISQQCAIVISGLVLHAAMVERAGHAFVDAKRDSGSVPFIHLGHSLGELSALAAAGALEPEAAVRITVARSVALLNWAPRGGMAALGADLETVERLIPTVDGISIATRNADQQVTISGGQRELAEFEKLCVTRRIAFRRLSAVFPYHSPNLSRAAAAFLQSLVPQPAAQEMSPVFSPIEGRFYQPGEDLRERLASHLVRPVDFRRAISALADRLEIGIEVTAGEALSRLARRGATAVDFVALCPDPACERDRISAVRDRLARLERNDPDTSRGIMMTPFSAYTDHQIAWLLQQLAQEVASRVERANQAMRAPVPPIPPYGWGSGWPVPMWPAEPQGSAPEWPGAPFGRPSPATADALMDRETDANGERRTVYRGARDGGAAASATAGTHTKLANLAAEVGDAGSPLATGPRESLEARIIRVYQEATEYPPDVFELDCDLEADLGIDSVKQGQILETLQRHFQLPPRTDIALSDHRTLRSVVELIRTGLDRGVLP